MKKMNMSDKISAMERWYNVLKSFAKCCDENYKSTYEFWENIIATNGGYITRGKQSQRNIDLAYSGAKSDVVNEILASLEQHLPFLKDIDT